MKKIILLYSLLNSLFAADSPSSGLEDGKQVTESFENYCNIVLFKSKGFHYNLNITGFVCELETLIPNHIETTMALKGDLKLAYLFLKSFLEINFAYLWSLNSKFLKRVPIQDARYITTNLSNNIADLEPKTDEPLKSKSGEPTPSAIREYHKRKNISEVSEPKKQRTESQLKTNDIFVDSSPPAYRYCQSTITPYDIHASSSCVRTCPPAYRYCQSIITPYDILPSSNTKTSIPSRHPFNKELGLSSQSVSIIPIYENTHGVKHKLQKILRKKKCSGVSQFLPCVTSTHSFPTITLQKRKTQETEFLLAPERSAMGIPGASHQSSRTSLEQPCSSIPQSELFAELSSSVMDKRTSTLSQYKATSFPAPAYTECNSIGPPMPARIDSVHVTQSKFEPRIPSQPRPQMSFFARQKPQLTVRPPTLPHCLPTFPFSTSSLFPQAPSYTVTTPSHRFPCVVSSLAETFLPSHTTYSLEHGSYPPCSLHCSKQVAEIPFQSQAEGQPCVQNPIIQEIPSDCGVPSGHFHPSQRVLSYSPISPESNCAEKTKLCPSSFGPDSPLQASQKYFEKELSEPIKAKVSTLVSSTPIEAGVSGVIRYIPRSVVAIGRAENFRIDEPEVVDLDE